MSESTNDIFRRNHCKIPEWIADLEMTCFDLEIQEFLEEHAFFKIFAAHCFHEIFRVAIFSIQIIFKGSFQSCNKSLINQACSGPYMENIDLFCTDLAALGPYCQQAGPIFSQYGPRAWLIRYMYRDPLIVLLTRETPIVYALLTKLVRSRWLDIGQVLFLRFYGPRRSRGP